VAGACCGRHAVNSPARCSSSAPHHGCQPPGSRNRKTSLCHRGRSAEVTAEDIWHCTPHVWSQGAYILLASLQRPAWGGGVCCGPLDAATRITSIDGWPTWSAPLVPHHCVYTIGFMHRAASTLLGPPQWVHFHISGSTPVRPQHWLHLSTFTPLGARTIGSPPLGTRRQLHTTGVHSTVSAPWACMHTHPSIFNTCDDHISPCVTCAHQMCPSNALFTYDRHMFLSHVSGTCDCHM